MSSSVILGRQKIKSVIFSKRFCIFSYSKKSLQKNPSCEVIKNNIYRIKVIVHYSYTNNKNLLISAYIRFVNKINDYTIYDYIYWVYSFRKTQQLLKSLTFLSRVSHFWWRNLLYGPSIIFKESSTKSGPLSLTTMSSLPREQSRVTP